MHHNTATYKSKNIVRMLGFKDLMRRPCSTHQKCMWYIGLSSFWYVRIRKQKYEGNTMINFYK